MRIESIADHFDLIEILGRWHWDEWGRTDPSGSLQSWTENLRRFTNRRRVPTMYVALDGAQLLGSVALNEHDMRMHQDLTPWLSGLYVTPAARGKGVGSALVGHLVAEARSMGIVRLYLYTSSARGLYEKLGWCPIAEDEYDDRHVTIMAIDVHGQ